MTSRALVSPALAAVLLAACAGRRMAEAPAPPPATQAPPVISASPATEAPPATPAPSEAPASADPIRFEASVKPLLARTCTPCHVPGGMMYERLPFDRPEVVLSRKDGIRRRLKDPSDREILERWLASQAPS